MIAGVFIYIVSLKIAFNIFPKTNSRFSAWDSEHIVDTIPELLIKLARIKSYIEKHLFIEDYLLSSTTKYAIVILIMGAIIAAILLILRKTNRDRALRIAVFLILFPCLFIAIYATDILTLKELLRMGYRHTSSIAMAYALLAFLCLSATQNQFVKNIYSIVTIFVLAQFIYTANIWWYSQSKLNEFDETLLNRILTRIETNPEFTNYKDQAIVFVGKLSDSEKPENYSLSTSHKPIKPIYQSAFQASWSQRGIFATKGIRLKKASEKDVLAAYEYAQRHEVWPHKESVAIENDLIIIVFENTDQP